MPPCFDRFIAPDVFETLMANENWHFLFENYHDGAPPHPDPNERLHMLDMHIRPDNALKINHGLRRLLVIHPVLNAGELEVTFDADEEYRHIRCPEAFAHLQDLRNIDSYIQYLQCAIARTNPGAYQNHREGYWQNRLCQRFGRNWRTDDPWLIIDRESMITFNGLGPQGQEPQQQLHDFIAEIIAAYAVIPGCPLQNNTTFKADFLAIGQNRELVCIELKHSSYRRIRDGLFQASAYRDAFQAAMQANDIISHNIATMVHQKIAMGLLPPGAADRLSDNGFDPQQVSALLLIAEPRNRVNYVSRLTQVRTDLLNFGHHVDVATIDVDYDPHFIFG